MNLFQRIERMSRMLSEQEYLRFQKSRQMSFASRAQPNKFRQWLLENRENDDQQPQPNPVALELMQHLAYELVASIVDLVFQVRQQQVPAQDDPVQRQLPSRMTSSSLPMFQIGNVGPDPLLPSVKTCSMSSPFLMPQSSAASHVQVCNIMQHFLI